MLKSKLKPVALCSLGDGSVTEGEVAEAFQMAVLKKLPILYLVQDNDWGISATGSEMRTMNAFEYAAGFKGLKRVQVDGSDFVASFEELNNAFDYVREERAPILVHAKCPLLGHHTSGVRKEWYRGENLAEQEKSDPIIKLQNYLLEDGETLVSLKAIQDRASESEICHSINNNSSIVLPLVDSMPARCNRQIEFQQSAWHQRPTSLPLSPRYKPLEWGY